MVRGNASRCLQQHAPTAVQRQAVSRPNVTTDKYPIVQKQILKFSLDFQVPFDNFFKPRLSLKWR